MKIKNKNTKYIIVYIGMFFFFIVAVVWTACRYDGPTLSEDFFGKERIYEEGWHTADGSFISLDKLNKVEGIKAGEEFSIYNTLPETIYEGDAICFRSKNIFYQIYIDGNLLYDPFVPESPIYTNSYGTAWTYMNIPTEYAGKEIEVRLTCAYDNARACIDHVVIAQPAGAILDTLGSKMVSFITCALLLFFGLLLMITDIPINIRSQKNHELCYLGLFAISIAIWCLSETNLLQFYLGDNRIMQVVSCASLMLISIPAMLYLDEAFGFRNRWILPLNCGFSILLFVVCWTLHFTGIADIHETLTLSHISLVISAVIMFYTILRHSLVVTKKKSRNVYRILRTIGLCSISVATVIDVIRYYRGNGTDSAMFVRIGLLLFIICFGASSLEKTVNAVKLGVQSEFVAQLAYVDGLTRIGNRTSFQEHLVDLEKVKDDMQAIGIVIFDVNDLKYVNDNLGHYLGDVMLVKSADIIKEAFQNENSKCYRIGGDEFAVVISGEAVKDRYNESTQRFRELIDQHNARPDKEFSISIASGFGVYDESSKGTKLMDIYQEADKVMYENKRKMKAKKQ